MEHTLIIAGLVAVAYLLGSIPTAVWIGKRFYGIDVREHGSHNAGATNTIRVLGLRTGLIVFVIDLAKGYCAVSLSLLAGWLGSSPQLHTLLGIGLGLAAIAGHIFPLFAGFRGGKGVATICGVALALHPWAALGGVCHSAYRHPLCVARLYARGAFIPHFPLFRISLPEHPAPGVRVRNRPVAPPHPSGQYQTAAPR